jgi:hypothetical protein
VSADDALTTTMAIWGYARTPPPKVATSYERDGKNVFNADWAGPVEWQRSKIEAFAVKRGMKLGGIRPIAPIAERPVGGPLFEKLATVR